MSKKNTTYAQRFIHFMDCHVRVCMCEADIPIDNVREDAHATHKSAFLGCRTSMSICIYICITSLRLHCISLALVKEKCCYIISPAGTL